MIGVRVALFYCCFVGIFSKLTTHPVNDSTEVFTNGTAELDGVRNRAAVLPVASAKADKADGSKYKVLNTKDDIPSGYNGPVKYERGQFVVDVGSKPFEGYLVREKGGDLNIGISVEDLGKLSSSFDDMDILEIEFVETKRYMDIEVARKAGEYLFKINEGTNIKKGGPKSTTREFRIKVPSVAHASLTVADDVLETKISYSSVTGTMITDSTEVISFKFYVVKSAAKFSLFFEPGQLAVIDPGPDKAAIIGGSVGGILGLGLVVAVGFFVWRHVKKQKEKKQVQKSAAVAETRGETGTDFESGNLEKSNGDRDQPGDVIAAKKRKVSKELKKEPETSKDSKTSEVKSVVAQNKSKEKVPSKKEVDKPVSQVLKQEDKKSVVKPEEDLKKELVGVDVGVNQVENKEAQTKDACDAKKGHEIKEQGVPNKEPKEGSGIVKVTPVVNQDVVADNKKDTQAPLPESVEKVKEDAVKPAAVDVPKETTAVVTNDKKMTDAKKESKSVKAASDGDKEKTKSRRDGVDGSRARTADKRDGLGGNKDATKSVSQESVGNVKGNSIKNAASIKKPRVTSGNIKKQEGVERKKERRGNRRKVSRDASQSSADKTREVTVEVEPETVTVADPAAAKTDEDGPINREPIKIEDIPPPSVRVVTAPIWTFTSRNSSKFARPPIPRSLPVDMGAPNPAFFQEGQGTAYQDAVEAVRKEQEEAEKRAEEMRVYEEHEAKKPSIYRTKYLVGPDPLGAPLYKSEEDDTVFKTPKRKRKKRSNR